jgi:tungstate transport system substrate-binding protein
MAGVFYVGLSLDLGRQGAPMPDKRNICSRPPSTLFGAIAITLLLASGARAQENLVRLAVVPTPVQSGLLDELLPDFEKQTGYTVQVRLGDTDVFEIARRGQADIVISHYGFEEVETFVQAGFGFWPRAVFSNQSALIGPPGDPALIRGLSSATEAFERIARTESLFVTNDLVPLNALVEVLWEGAGRPNRGEWYLNLGLQGSNAIEAASSLGAYTVWGADPFIRYLRSHSLNLELLSVNDPILQRMMVSVVVNPDSIPGVNVEGARALETYLLAAPTQARIQRFRYPDFDAELWWPSGLQN